jgi:hypothetical protein
MKLEKKTKIKNHKKEIEKPKIIFLKTILKNRIAKQKIRKAKILLLYN